MTAAPTTAIAEYSPIESALASVEKYRGLVCDVSTPKGLAEAKAAHKEVATLRIALKKTRKKVKEDVVARGKLIDGEANRIFTLIAAIEDPIKTQIDAEERRAEEQRQAEIKAEQDRLAKEEADRKAAEEKRLAEERAKNEAEARRLIEEKARFEAAQIAARQKVEAEDQARRAALKAEEDAARARIAEQERVAREAREEQDRQAKALRDAEEARQQVERDRLAALQRAEDEKRRQEEAEAEAKAKAEQERKDAEARERQRLVMEKADSRTSLELWRNRYGHLPEYAEVVRAIDECLEPA